MLEQFKQKYLEEVNDLLNEMESALLELEHSPDNEDGVNKIFRVMHTIKGTSGMYDFKDVETLTHQVENVFGAIRDNHQPVSKSLISTTLEGVDLIRQMLNTPEGNYTEQQSKFLAKLTGNSSNNTSETSSPSSDNTNNDDNNIGMATYYVAFKPDADITSRGVNLTRIIEDLDRIPGIVIIPHNYPDSEEFSSKFFMYWEAVFATDRPLADIEEIFLFANDEAEITRIAPYDLFQNAEFVSELQRQQESGNDLDLEAISILVKDFKIDVQKPEVKTPTEPSADNIAKEESIIGRNIDAFETKNTSIKVAADKLDELMNLVSDLVVTKAQVQSIADKYDLPELDNLYEKIDKLSNKFKDNALSMRLLPIESMMLRFERLIRDLSKELGKQIDFFTEGTDTELDKTIIDNIAVPLMHIIRNSIDHGIEPVERRRELKKPDHGVIKFTAFYSGANVFIQVQDDGAGMNPEYLKQKAIEKGFLKPGQPVTTRQLYDLVFLPGFSTAQTITGISGRGVGMDVVKQHIIKLRGEIEMDSEVNLGTITTIKLPLTLSIVDSLLVALGDILMLIPLYLVDSCIQTSINGINPEKRIFVYNGDPLPVINLRKLLETGDPQPDTTALIIVKYKELRICLTADKVIGEHQAVLKSLGPYFAYQEYISGASILGDGRIALVLDTNKLIRLVETHKNH